MLQLPFCLDGDTLVTRNAPLLVDSNNPPERSAPRTHRSFGATLTLHRRAFSATAGDSHGQVDLPIHGGIISSRSHRGIMGEGHSRKWCFLRRRKRLQEDLPMKLLSTPNFTLLRSIQALESPQCSAFTMHNRDILDSLHRRTRIARPRTVALQRPRDAQQRAPLGLTRAHSARLWVDSCGQRPLSATWV